jgi:nitroimidazol reductase NimA-like FMN-containing flavoprotein (pyridoxamine 5'-phosphate oxidase superfamily)
LDNQPHVVPVHFYYADEGIYLFSTVGKKIKWMRQNPKACLQVDEIGSTANWSSVIVSGRYTELPAVQYAGERERALEGLSQYSSWWVVPLAERRETVSDLALESVFFRIDIETISGLRALPEK